MLPLLSSCSFLLPQLLSDTQACPDIISAEADQVCVWEMLGPKQKHCSHCWLYESRTEKWLGLCLESRFMGADSTSIPEIFTEHGLCAKHCSRYWGLGWVQHACSCPCHVRSSGGEALNKEMPKFLSIMRNAERGKCRYWQRGRHKDQGRPLWGKRMMLRLQSLLAIGKSPWAPLADSSGLLSDIILLDSQQAQAQCITPFLNKNSLYLAPWMPDSPDFPPVSLIAPSQSSLPTL